MHYQIINIRYYPDNRRAGVPFRVAAGELRPGDCVESAAGVCREVERTRVVPGSITVYNFTVEKAHTYFVGKGAWWVHNRCSKLKTALGGVAGDGYDGHHLIPKNSAGRPFVHRARAAGWDMDAVYNGILLPENAPLGLSRNLPYHAGRHPQYSAEVNAVLDLLEDKAIRNGWSNADARRILEGYAMGLEAYIRNLPAGSLLR